MLGATLAAEDDVTGPGGPAGPVSQGQQHGQHDALLDPDERYGQHGDDCQPEFQPVEAQDRSQHPHPEQPGGDEDQDGPERRLGQALQEPGGQQHDAQDDGGGNEAGEL